MAATIIGFKEFEGKLNNLPIELQEEVNQEVVDEGLEWAQLAIISAPVYDGDLRKGIGSVQTVPMTAEVYSNSESSPWNEWGTGHRVFVPGDLSAYASQFRGAKSPGRLTAKEAIYQWAKRHGIENPWFVYKSILENGRYPHPFFFIHKPIIESKLLETLTKIINTQH